MSAIDQIIVKLQASTEKEEYIEKIIEQLNACNDIPLLDLIYKLLCKSL